MIKKIIFEVSETSVFREGIRGELDRFFMGNFILHLSTYKIPISVISTPACFGVERINPKGCLTFAFHAYNNPENMWSYKESPINGLYSVDKNGYSGSADICVNFNNYRDEIDSVDITLAEEVIQKQLAIFNANKSSKYSQKEGDLDDLPSNFIFFPLQVTSDSVAEYENISSSSVLEKVADLALQKKKYIVVKRHPWCNSSALKEMLDLLSLSNPYIKVVNANIHDLIEKSDAILSCNSGVSFEALIHGKPVYCFGRSEWYEATNKIEKISDLEQLFSCGLVGQSNFQKKIIAYLLSTYWIQHNDTLAIYRKIRECLCSFVDESTDQVDRESIDQIIEDQLDLQAISHNIEHRDKKAKRTKETSKVMSIYDEEPISNMVDLERVIQSRLVIQTQYTMLKREYTRYKKNYRELKKAYNRLKLMNPLVRLFIFLKGKNHRG